MRRAKFNAAAYRPYSKKLGRGARTRKGRKELSNVRKAPATIEHASAELLDLAGKNAWQALWSMERACREQPFLERLQRHATARRKELLAELHARGKQGGKRDRRNEGA